MGGEGESELVGRSRERDEGGRWGREGRSILHIPVQARLMLEVAAGFI